MSWRRVGGKQFQAVPQQVSYCSAVGAPACSRYAVAPAGNCYAVVPVGSCFEVVPVGCSRAAVAGS